MLLDDIQMNESLEKQVRETVILWLKYEACERVFRTGSLGNHAERKKAGCDFTHGMLSVARQLGINPDNY